jgi:hypothetical protein
MDEETSSVCMKRAAAENVSQKQERETGVSALHCFRTVHNCAFPLYRWVKVSLFDSYRPELHYMRGPGPKWREADAHRRLRELDGGENVIGEERDI